ncbi:hypothetical protein P3S67_032342 [Capsicum chacoense]
MLNSSDFNCTEVIDKFRVNHRLKFGVSVQHSASCAYYYISTFLKVAPLSSLSLVDQHITHVGRFQQVSFLQNPDAYG